MKTGLSGISTAEFTRRMIERPGPGNWLILVAPTGETTSLGEQIAFGVGLEAESGESPATIQPRDANELVEEVARRRHLVVTGVDEWPLTEWARLDTLRSRLVVAQRVAFVMSESAAKHLLIGAPHFARFFSGSAWRVVLDKNVMSADDRQARILRLEAWSQLTTEEMIGRAERRELPADPEYAEWLALVTRIDLL